MNKKGFTLVEMMVAVSIFVIVAFIATGAIISLSEANRKAQAIKLAIDNLNFAVDSMALKLREGFGRNDDGSYSYSGNGDCPNSFSEVSFKYPESDDEIFTYTYEAENGRILASTGGEEHSLTSNEISISKFCILVEDSGVKDLITLLAEGSVGAADNPTTFTVQTSVSRRRH